jgi:putative RecB family exonuclease
MAIYSYSRVSAFEQCPLKYRFSYIDGVRMRRKSVEAFLGSRFHEVMEHLYRRVPHGVPSPGDLKALFCRLWDAKWEEGILVLNPEKRAEDYRALGLRAIDDYCRRYAPFSDGRVVGLEREIAVDLGGDGRHMLRCIIDRLVAKDGDLFEIHDYKTSGFLPEQKDLDRDMQLGLYDIAVRSAWPQAKGVELVWHYVAFDMEMRSRRTEGEARELRRRTISLIDEIEGTSEFCPRESNLCSWCDFQPICPLFSHRFKAESLPLERYAEDGGIGIVNRYAALDAEKHMLSDRVRKIEAEQERLRDQAVAEAAKIGASRLFGDTHMLTVRDDMRVRYPKKEELARPDFERRMRELGFLEDVLDVSYHGLKSLAEREDWAGEKGVPGPLAEFLSVETVKQVRLARRRDRKDDEEL